MNDYAQDYNELIVELLTEIRDMLEDFTKVDFIPDFNIDDSEH